VNYRKATIIDAVQYKGFYTFVKVRRENASTSLEVISQICRVPDETQLVRNWMTIQEFVSSKAAYEFGLQEAREWIDEAQ